MVRHSILDHLLDREASFSRFVVPPERRRLRHRRALPGDSLTRSRARLPALYSDFQTQRTLNPDGFQANVAAWRRALANITRSGLAPSAKGTKPSLLVLNCDEQLVRALESNQYGRPLALGAVIREALSAKDLVPLHDFLLARESIYHKPWSAWNIAAWALKQFGVADVLRSDRLPTGQFVVVANVEDTARMFGNRNLTDSRFDRTFSKEHFYKTFAGQLIEGQQLSETDVEVLLTFLARDKCVLLYNGRTVKIKAPGKQEPSGITDEDMAIAQLKEALVSLTHQTSILSKRIEELGKAAQEAVAKKNRVAALAALKSKKLAEKTLEKRFETLGQLEEVSTKIEQASDNVQFVSVMEASGAALRSLNARTGGVERVDKVVDRLREQMEAADEVSTILAESSGTIIDETELDVELAAMEGEERRREEDARRSEQDRRRKVEEAEAEAKEAEETCERLAAIEKPAEEASRVEKMMGRMTLDENR